jgi:hypothetical protein
MYLVKCRHPLATRYYDTSVIEAYSISVLFSILNRTKLLEALGGAGEAAVRK